MARAVVCSIIQSLKRERSPFVKSILIIDDNPDITLTFKKGLEAENNKRAKITIYFLRYLLIATLF